MFVVIVVRLLTYFPIIFCSMKSRGSTLLRVTAGFVAGSAVGWVAHDRRHAIDSFLGRSAENDQSTESRVGRVWSFSETPNFKPPIPWNQNWDMWVAVFIVTSCSALVWISTYLILTQTLTLTLKPDPNPNTSPFTLLTLTDTVTYSCYDVQI